MSIALAKMANDYAAAYKADIASFRTKDQVEKICSIADRVAQSCSDCETGAKSASAAKSDIQGALVVGEAIAKNLAKEDAAWIAKQATINQGNWRKKATEQQAEDQKLLSNLGALSSQLGQVSQVSQVSGNTPAYEQLVDSFERGLSSENQLIS